MGSLAGLLLYTAWIGGPYLRSIFIRDAAVTTWISVAASPIEGYFDKSPLYPGQRGGQDGVIATIVNPLADATPLAKAQADLDKAENRVAALQSLIGSLQVAIDSRSKEAEDYASAFMRDLDARILTTAADITTTKERLRLARVHSARLARLSSSGYASQSAADVAAAAVLEEKRALIRLEGELQRAEQRREAAEHNTLLLDDAEDGAVALRSLDDFRVNLNRSVWELEAAKTDAITAAEVLEKAQALYERNRRAPIEAKPGAMVWSLIAAPGVAVQPGTPVMSWIDCSVMLVDVPVQDVEIALLPPGASVDIVIEGEHEVRKGTVVLKRGAAATIGQVDLAAIAKGRQPGIGQVLVKLDPSPADIDACPIGSAAYVDFPGVGLIDILKARLRL
ncbi:MAG: hypothetical protein ACRECX_03080 [Methyloceanibacter sp.]|uniref:hypothetical protein n=1 Tax=Methyloceanibacter sp. TaxID=1965321 RepID=UPI003D6D06AD